MGNDKDKVNPERIYKYMPPERESFFEDRKIRFTQPADLNDPFEFRPHVESHGEDATVRNAAVRGLINILQSKGHPIKIKTKVKGPLSFEEFSFYNDKLNKKKIDSAIKRLSPQITKLIQAAIPSYGNKNLGVLSLTAEKENHLMWAHYTVSHTGFLIELDAQHDFFHQKNIGKLGKGLDGYGHLHKVQYSNIRPVLKRLNSIGPKHFLIKSDLWTYEREYRMILPLENGVRKTPSSNIFLFEVPCAAITKIILGIRASNDLISKAKRLAQAPGCQHITFEQCQLDEKFFKINFINLG